MLSASECGESDSRKLAIRRRKRDLQKYPSFVDLKICGKPVREGSIFPEVDILVANNIRG